ncbi:hypothetical protein EG832_02135 [bacterium]|nr:hypothetical protein [bacterium]
MNFEDFGKLLQARLQRTEKVLSGKAKEYSMNGDRLHNFKVAARITGETPEKALFGMFLKHLVSIMDIIDKPGSATPEQTDEKIGDAINYLILLEAMLSERRSLSDVPFSPTRVNLERKVDINLGVS